MFDELINNFFVIKPDNEITNDDAVIEHCGDYVAGLNGYSICISLSLYDDLLNTLRNLNPEVYNQVLKLQKDVSVIKLIAETFIKAKEVRPTNFLVDTYKGNLDALLNAYKYNCNMDYNNNEYNYNQGYNQGYAESRSDYNNNYNQMENTKEEDDTFTREDLLEIINVISNQYPTQADLVRKTALRMYDSGNIEGASELALTVVNDIIGGNE